MKIVNCFLDSGDLLGVLSLIRMSPDSGQTLFKLIHALIVELCRKIKPGR